MIYLICVVRGLLDPVFSFKDEHKSEQDSEIKEERAYSGLQSRLLGDYRVVTRYIGIWDQGSERPDLGSQAVGSGSVVL